MGLTIHVDGGARGNPGPAGAGVVIHSEDGNLLHESAHWLGTQTNNAAEYHALIRALQRAQRFDARKLAIYSDSELLVRQLTGEYRVKSPRLAQLHEQVQLLLIGLSRWSVKHIRREENKRADELANLAMDRRTSVVVFDADGDSGGGDNSADADTPRSEQSAAKPSPESGSPPEPGRAAVQIRTTRAPTSCPAPGFSATAHTVTDSLPSGVCVHGAHAILPTLLAMLNTDPADFSALPTLTVRCTRDGCQAEFQLSPVHSSNGASRDEKAQDA